MTDDRRYATQHQDHGPFKPLIHDASRPWLVIRDGKKVVSRHMHKAGADSAKRRRNLEVSIARRVKQKVSA